jgi:hypothetical protein
MKFLIKPIVFAAIMILGGKTYADEMQIAVKDTLPAPHQIWKEHWFEHDLILSRTYYDHNVAFYYDSNMDKTVVWPYKTLSAAWAYVKKTYGGFGPDPRLYVVLHRVVNNKLGGGHPASYFDDSHDHHNTIDCGLGDWSDSTGQNIGMPVHEMGHIVSGASHGVKGSPSDVLWGDSKFMEIFNYDILKHIGRNEESAKVYQQMQSQYDDFPRARSQWFKNWFYPIYSQYGQAKVLNRYFALLAANFPKRDGEYTRDLNWGEFVHFWSGAAGVNLKAQAALAFGWTDEWEAQLEQAKRDFPAVKYQ